MRILSEPHPRLVPMVGIISFHFLVDSQWVGRASETLIDGTDYFGNGIGMDELALGPSHCRGGKTLYCRLPNRG